MLAKSLSLLALSLLCASPVLADEAARQPLAGDAQVRPVTPVRAPEPSKASVLLDRASSYLGIKYRLGGDGPTDGGFDCSGLVRKVFGDAIGLNLPRTAHEMASVGDTVRNKEELKPGDLVFFKTMRRTFSHVGIYMGDNRFVHAPSTGGRVRVDDLRDSYWVKAFKGARRLVPEANAATLPSPMLTPQQLATPAVAVSEPLASPLR